MSTSAREQKKVKADAPEPADGARDGQSAVPANGTGAQASSGNGADGHSGVWGAGTFSEDDADRLAAGIRASWEYPLDDVDTQVEGEWGLPAEAAADEATAVSPAPEPEPPAPPPTPAAAPKPAAPAAAARKRPPPRQAAARDPFIAEEPIELPRARSGSRMPLVIGAVVVLAAAAVGIGFAVSGGEDTPHAAANPSPPTPAATAEPAPEPEATPGETAPEPSASETEAVAVEAAAEEEAPAEETAETEAEEPVEEASEPEAPPPPVMAHVRVRTRPAEASLSLDGAAILNPYEADVEQDGSTHEIVARADGYRDATIQVSYSGDLDRLIRLERAPEPPVVASRPPHPAQQARQQRPRQPRPPRQQTRRPPRHGAGFVTANPY